MNNDYNNFGRDNGDEEKRVNGEQISEEKSWDSVDAGELGEGTSPQREVKNTPEQDHDGEYRFGGRELGDHRREDTADRNHESGSYTHRGSYGQSEYPHRNNPYGDYDNYNNYNERREPPRYYHDHGEDYPRRSRGEYSFEPDHTPPKPPKKRTGVSAGAVAVTMIVGVLLSAAAGFGGAYLYNDMYKSESVSSVGGADSGAVLHRVVETDSSTSTGVKGIYTDVAETVKASVVEITTEFQVTGFFQYVSEGAGSGVIISEDGYIITNNHVISDSDSGNTADTIKVRLTDGKEYDAKLVGKDADSDIAVIKIEPEEKLSFAVFGDSDTLTVGEEVIAVGNPLGELGGTVTNGIISALDREINVDGTTMNLLQTNAAINPGNSGGGLFNMKGELIGVVNAKSSGSGIEGLGFAIPSNDAFSVAEMLMENGYVTGKVYLGVSFYDVTDPYTAYRYFKSQATGVYVADLVEGYNDQVLKYGDRIVAVDGNEITEFSQIKDLLKEHAVGDTLEFTIYRSGKLTEVNVTCYEYVPEDMTVDFAEES